MNLQTTPSFTYQKKIFDGFETALVMVLIQDLIPFQDRNYFLAAFSDHEQQTFSTPKGLHSWAARYAAKRAAEILSGEYWHSFEVIRWPDSPPRLHKRQDQSDHPLECYSLSLSHDEPFAAAYLSKTVLS